MLKRYIIGLAVLLLLLLPYSKAAIVGTASLRAPAVVLSNNTGSLTNISLTITGKGTGNVVILGPQIVGATTTQSAQIGATYAAAYTNHNFTQYNYTYDIEGAGENVSGPSAGAAMTMLAVSAFTGKPLRTDFTMTGTISANGSIGEIGGVYDKVGAAKNNGIKLVLVPKVQSTDPEDELYLLVQTNFGIPLVQVANISQAAYFAFSNISGTANMTNYSFYRNYNVASLPVANLSCTGYCNETLFGDLLNATFNLTRTEIANLSANPKYASVSSQFGRILNQSVEIAGKGYDYTAADIAFLDYVNVFYFNGYSTNRVSALNLLDNVQSFCSSLSSPQLTTSNYDYVINAELRQTWGNFTINATVSAYNSSQIDSDQILDELYLGAQANGWCTAANLVYTEASLNNLNGTDVVPSSALKAVAASRISRASQYGDSLYFTTAEQAYKAANYPVAILDADYAYALTSAASNTTRTTSQLNGLSSSIAKNSTYSVWATEFSKEALFYVYQSDSTANSTLSKSYAQEGYAAALLAQQISNDTKIIQKNLVPGVQPTVTINPGGAGQPAGTSSQQSLQYNQIIILALIAIIIILLVINVILLSIITSNKQNKKTNKNRKSRK